MGTGRKLNKKPVTRPKKSPADVRRRHIDQARRLVGLGVAEEVVAKMQPQDVREMLKRPAAIQVAG